jgi:hypothetical protein
MLVSDIITKGRNLVDVPNTSFYSDAEALQDVQLGWNEIYSMMADANDDFFVTQVYIDTGTLTADSNRQYVYSYTLPSDFYRLRLLQYNNGLGYYEPFDKVTLEDFGFKKGYRFFETTLKIYDPNLSSTYAIWYYPAPATLTTGTDLTFPQTMIPQILAYQVAVEIRRKQNLPIDGKEEKRQELLKTMKAGLYRDDFRPESIKNVFHTSWLGGL